MHAVHDSCCIVQQRSAGNVQVACAIALSLEDADGWVTWANVKATTRRWLDEALVLKEVTDNNLNAQGAPRFQLESRAFSLHFAHECKHVCFCKV